tara:strand:+ start:331 stop:543 length:213 start_codon:yes stop_codon:yes gene_type:complete
MKDQKSIDRSETSVERYQRAVDLVIESLYKPDDTIRSCAHNQRCFEEMMSVREDVLQYLISLKHKSEPAI